MNFRVKAGFWQDKSLGRRRSKYVKRERNEKQERRDCLTEINSTYSEPLEGSKAKNNRAICWMEGCQVPAPLLSRCRAWVPFKWLLFPLPIWQTFQRDPPSFTPLIFDSKTGCISVDSRSFCYRTINTSIIGLWHSNDTLSPHHMIGGVVLFSELLCR